MAGEASQGCRGRSREGSVSLSLLPTPQTHHEVFFTCRLTRSLNKAHDWDGARAWNHPSRPGRPHPSLQPPRGFCLGEARRGLGALLPAPHTSPCRSSGPQTTLRPRRPWWELSVQDHKPSSALARDGQSIPQTLMPLSLWPPALFTFLALP